MNSMYHLQNVSSVATMSEDTKVEMTSTGVRVSGAFDTLTIFNANGQKVLETSHASTSCSFRLLRDR